MTVHQSSIVQEMSDAALAFLGSLASEQRSKASFPFPAHDERHRWY